MSSVRRAAKVGHRKTRTGCLRCRARRVKCDEQHPVCATCSRLGLQCEYASTAKPTATRASSKSSPSEVAEITSNHPSPDDTIASEALSPRLQRLQLRLLHAYTVRSVSPRSIQSWPTSREWLNAWFVDLPKLAFEHDNLLYALLSFSAIQIGTSDPEIAFAQAEFWSLALKEQRDAIARPDHHREAAVLAGYLLSMTCFGMLRDRPLSPYVPPVDWFELAQGVSNLCPRFEDMPEGSSVLLVTMKVSLPIWKQSKTVDERYQPLLAFQLAEEGEDQCGIHNAYLKALGCVSGFARSIAAEEIPGEHIRWICTFVQIVPGLFVTLLREQRPRALAVMACFWAALTRASPFVLQAFGDMRAELPGREIRAILAQLSGPWQNVLRSSVEEIGQFDRVVL